MTAAPLPPVAPASLLRFAAVHARTGHTGAGSAGEGDRLRGFSLEVRRGEFLSLVGAPGSGGATAAALLAGQARAETGEVLLRGESLARLPAHRRGIGAVFRRPALFGHMNVAENAAFPLRVRGIGAAERRMRAGNALELLGVAGCAGLMPDRLTPAQAVRAALARAVAAGPDLLVLDRPLVTLAAEERETLQTALRQLHALLGITVLHAAGDVPEALALATRIAVLRDGAVVQAASPASLLDLPATAFVARFIGGSNLLPGLVRGVEDGIAAVALDCGPAVAARAEGVAGGEHCTVAIRPDRIALASAEAASLSEDALPATLLESVLLGDRVRLRLAIGAGGEVDVLRPAAARLPGLVPGRPAALAWQPEHALAFPEEGGEAGAGAAESAMGAA